MAQVDFYSMLSGLGDTIAATRKESARREALAGARNPDGSVDFQKAILGFAQSGDMESAAKAAAIQKAVSPEYTPDIQNYNFAVKHGYKGSPLDFAKEKAAAGATRVNTNNTVTSGGGSDKQIFDTVDESAKAARTAASGLAGLGEARKALSGGMISGFGADQRLILQKAAAALGLADSDKIENTETFRAAIAPQVSAMIKATVGTANISNADREFAEKAAGGNITLDPKSIGRLLGIMERAGKGIVEGHNKRLDAVYPNDPKFRRERALFAVPAPVAATDGGPIAPPKSNVPTQAPRRAPDGKLYVPDPARPGKFLQIVE